MHRYIKNFFSSKRANAFVEELYEQGIKAIIISYNDAFGQKIYSVRWN